MDFKLMLLVGGLSLGGVVVYVLFMIFLPEWVGITGKKAREAQEAHRGVQSSGPDLFDRMHSDSSSKNKDEGKP